jgi:hypothetical protein
MPLEERPLWYLTYFDNDNPILRNGLKGLLVSIKTTSSGTAGACGFSYGRWPFIGLGPLPAPSFPCPGLFPAGLCWAELSDC